MPDRCGGLAEANRVVELQSGSPFLIGTSPECCEEAIGFITWVRCTDQVIAESAVTILAEGIQSGPSIQASGDDFEFAAFDIPLLATDFNATIDRIAERASLSWAAN